jgi:hypothetical protein
MRSASWIGSTRTISAEVNARIADVLSSYQTPSKLLPLSTAYMIMKSLLRICQRVYMVDRLHPVGFLGCPDQADMNDLSLSDLERSKSLLMHMLPIIANFGYKHPWRPSPVLWPPSETR